VIEIDPSAPFAEWAANTALALPDRPIAVRDMLG
jgi:hypothetical protein